MRAGEALVLRCRREDCAVVGAAAANARGGAAAAGRGAVERLVDGRRRREARLVSSGTRPHRRVTVHLQTGFATLSSQQQCLQSNFGLFCADPLKHFPRVKKQTVLSFELEHKTSLQFPQTLTIPHSPLSLCWLTS